MKKLSFILVAIMALLIGVLPSCAGTSDVPHPFRGVNTAGSEMDWGLPGTPNKANTDNPTSGADFLFISNQDIDYLVSKKVGFIRLVISWEGLQPVLNQPLSTGIYNQTLQARVAYATSKGMNVLIEPHGGSDGNFNRWKGNLVGTTAVPNSAFADFWTRMAVQFKSNPKVMYGLMNEPHDMSTMQWFGSAQAAINGIRSTGSTQMIFVPGNGWSGAASWSQNWYDTASTKVSNANGFLTLVDPAKNLVASVHLYLDQNAGGGATDIVSPTIGVERLSGVVAWAKTNGVKVHMSEIGASYWVDPDKKTTVNTAAAPALKNLFDYIQANNTVVIGWSWWAYGPPQWWGNNKLTLCPTSNYTVDDPKMAWISPWLVQPAPVFPSPDASVPPPVDAAPPVVSPSFPTKPMTVTKDTVFTTTSPAPTATDPTFKQTNWAFVPKTYDSTHNTPTQLFVWLHGCGGQSQWDAHMVSFMPDQKWISLAPGGREGACWSGEATDGAKVLAAIADMKTRFNIDPYRIVIGGYSSGGDIGYPLLFKNAKLFAGGLFENTGPSTTAMTLATTATWKVNIAHLHHTGDTTYPIAALRTKMTTLKSSGFPVVLIEKPGTHYDKDNGATGTQYDLRTFLLPHLNNGWVAPGGVVVPPPPAACVYTYSEWGVCQSNNTQTRTVTGSTPVPCTASTQVLSQACTFVPPPVEAGPDTSVPDAAPLLPLKQTVRITYNWGTGYCEEIDIVNKNLKGSLTWSSFQLNLRGGVIRDKNDAGPPWDTWNGNFPAKTGVITITPATWNKTVLPNTKATVGYCADFGPQKWTGTIVVGSLKP